MKEQPILFSADMVRAILDGRKTMTRRVIKPQPPDDCVWDEESGLFAVPESALGLIRHCPYEVGMNLWVRETLAELDDQYGGTSYAYKADASYVEPHKSWDKLPKHIIPSIFMPRWASRITLDITGVRVERVQDITVEDARSEGVEPLGSEGDSRRWRASFHELWDSLNAKRGYGWTTNPWVWVITFERTNRNVHIERE